MLVELTESELAQCLLKAQNDMSDPQQCSFDFFNNESRFANRLIGIKCEYCFLKAYNIIPDNFFKKGLMDNGYDYLNQNEVTFDIKGTKWATGNLRLTQYQFDNAKADFFVLVCRQTESTFDIVGFISRLRFKTIANKHVDNGFPSYRVDRKDLIFIDNVVDFLVG
jgi:hypothetical protein